VRVEIGHKPGVFRGTGNPELAPARSVKLMPKQRELNVLPRARIPVEMTRLAEKHPAIMQRAFYDLNGPPLRTNRAEPGDS
jgi:hypothetical protein